MHALTPIADVMTRDPLTVDADLPLADARDRMSNDRIRHLPVVREGRVVGILSARDIMLFEDFKALSSEQATVESAMTANPVFFGPSEPVGRVLEQMLKRDIGAVVVKDGDALVGVFTDSDAVRLLRDVLAGG